MKNNIDWGEIVGCICVFLIVATMATCAIKVKQSSEKVQIEKIKQK